jgi:hypothetical protein
MSRKGEGRKAELVRRFFQEETTMALARIAQRLRTGSWDCVANLLKAKVKSANIWR